MRVAIEAMGPAIDRVAPDRDLRRLASIIFGAVAAIGQSNIKRLLAYSSINNVGFVLVGLAAGTPEGVASVLLYLTIYVAMTLGAFLVVLQMRDADGEPVESIDSLSGLSRHAAGPGRGDGDLHVQPRRHPAAARLLRQVGGVQRGGAGRAVPARGGRHRRLGDRRLSITCASSR